MRARLDGLDAVLCVGTGFVIRPLVDAVALHAWLQVALALVYLTVAYRRVMPRLGPEPVRSGKPFPSCCPGCNPRGCHCQECFCREGRTGTCSIRLAKS